jgi:MarC family membrane protein
MSVTADLALYIKFFIGLFALVNPVGILPFFIALTANLSPPASRRINLTASITVAIILWSALFLGDGILRVFGVSVDSFRIAGGILLCSIAMTMVTGKLGENKINTQEQSEAAQSNASHGNIGVVPLALPMMAGPGAISSTIVWGTRHNDWPSLLGLAVAAGIFAACCWGLYRCAPLIVRILGQTGINVITRIMGILLMALGIEFVVTGIRNFFPALS